MRVALVVLVVLILVPLVVEAGGVASERRLTPGTHRASEVAIAADPRDAAHLVAAANSNGGFEVYVSRNAGATWTANFLPQAAVGGVADRGRFLFLSDPVVAFGSDGIAYLAGLAYVPTSSVFVVVSRDGGDSWPESHIIHESDVAASFNDKPWLAVSPATGTMLSGWQKEPALDALRDVEAASGIDADIGDIVVSRSTDGGASWSLLPQRISRGHHNNGTQLGFDAAGRAHALWVNYEVPAIEHAYSDDDAASWSAPQQVAPIVLPVPTVQLSRMHTLPAMTIGAGGVYAVWHDLRNGNADVYAAASFDGGGTWSAPVRVNDDATSGQQIFPWAAVASDGGLRVGYYDGRQNATHAKLRLEYWSAAAAPGTLNFAPSYQVSTRAFNATDIGDYTGMAASPLGVFPVWSDDRAGAQVWGARLS